MWTPLYGDMCHAPLPPLLHLVMRKARVHDKTSVWTDSMTSKRSNGQHTANISKHLSNALLLMCSPHGETTISLLSTTLRAIISTIIEVATTIETKCLFLTDTSITTAPKETRPPQSSRQNPTVLPPHSHPMWKTSTLITPSMSTRNTINTEYSYAPT